MDAELIEKFNVEDLAMAKKFSDELGCIQYRMHACHLLEEQLSIFIRLFIGTGDIWILDKFEGEQCSARGVWKKLRAKETECYAKIIAYKENYLFLNCITRKAEKYVRSFSDREIFENFQLSIKEDNTSVIKSLLLF